MKTVLLITNIPTPYRIPLFNTLSVQLFNNNIKLHVVFATVGYQRRKWNIDMSDCNFSYTVLKSNVIGGTGKENLTFNYQGLNKLVKSLKPSLVITNEFSVATIKLWLKSFISDLPYIIWSGGIGGEHHKISMLRAIQRRLLVRRSSGFIAYGTKAKQNLVSLGASNENTYIAINTVDTEYFRNESDNWRENNKVRPGSFVYVGHLTKGKRVDLLLLAAKNIYEKCNINIDIVGDGPEMDNLKQLAAQLGIEKVINFVGFRQKHEIPELMASANCFVFPSEYDVWGLVLVEAMACGLPCISSYKAGATIDLITEEKTGFIVDFEKIDEVSKRMQWIAENPDATSIMGQAARDHIQNHVNLEVSAKGFVDAIEHVSALHKL